MRENKLVQERRSRLCDLVVCLAFLAVVLAPHSAAAMRPQLNAMLAAPSWAHPLGTDNLGRDLLARVAAALHGASLPLWAAASAGFVAGLLLAALRLLAPQLGWLGALGGRAVGVLLGSWAAVPAGLLALAAAVWWEQGGLLPVMMVLALVVAASAFQQVIDLFRRDAQLAYWESHEALGGSLLGRIVRYGFAGSWGSSLLHFWAFQLRVVVTIEASLAYLGFGVQEPRASLGNILASHFDRIVAGQLWVLGVVAAALLLAGAFPAACVRLAGSAASHLALRAARFGFSLKNFGRGGVRASIEGRELKSQ